MTSTRVIVPRMARILVSVFVVQLGYPSAGSAADATEGPVKTKPPSGSAQALYRQGVAAYDQRDLERALSLFEQAYAVSKAPALLFNLGQVEKALGRCRPALVRFDAFLAISPQDAVAPKARELAEELRMTCQAAVAAVPAETVGKDPTAAVPKPAPVAQPPAATARMAPVSQALASRTLPSPGPGDRGSGAIYTACKSSVGATLALGILGIGFGAASWAAAQEAEERMVWDLDAQRADERGRTLADASLVSLVSAGTLAVASVGICLLAEKLNGRQGSTR